MPIAGTPDIKDNLAAFFNGSIYIIGANVVRVHTRCACEDGRSGH